MQLKGWRTLVFNILTLLALLLGGLTGQITDADTLRYIGIAMAVVNILLRWVTDGPVALKRDGGDV